MAVRIQWQPPLVLEERKKAQWEKIIRFELGELEDPLDVSLRFDADSLRWKVEAQPARPSGSVAPHTPATASWTRCARPASRSCEPVPARVAKPRPVASGSHSPRRSASVGARS